MAPDTRTAARDEPAWVLERYIEARELLAEVRELRACLPVDLWERIDWFHAETFMDTCTTLGTDCACNAAGSPAEMDELWERVQREIALCDAAKARADALEDEQ